MPTAIFRFHAELNDFLPKKKRQVDFDVTFNRHETVKHLVESLGVPHTEIDVILIEGVSVDFAVQPRDGDRVEVFPDADLLKGIPVIHLQPVPGSDMRFVLDGHLGKLASYLRLLGFDALYRNDYGDEELAEISSCEDRILLTRDRGLLKRNRVKYGYCVRGKLPQQQVVEILVRFNLAGKTRPFSRCARCNGVLVPISKADVFDRLEPKTKLYYDDFRICVKCERIYWKGSHFKRMESQLQDFLRLSDLHERL